MGDWRNRACTEHRGRGVPTVRTMLGSAIEDRLLRAKPVHIKGAAVERSVERPELDWTTCNASPPSVRGSMRWRESEPSRAPVR